MYLGLNEQSIQISKHLSKVSYSDIAQKLLHAKCRTQHGGNNLCTSIRRKTTAAALTKADLHQVPLRNPHSK